MARPRGRAGAGVVTTAGGLIAEGLSHTEIAARLVVSEATVKTRASPAVQPPQ